MPPIATMSDERREKKRKHDRDAQRVARERTKARVKELEVLVQTLRTANENPEQLSEILAQLETAREANAKLQDKMRKAVELLRLSLPAEGEAAACSLDSRSSLQHNPFDTGPAGQDEEESLDPSIAQGFDDCATPFGAAGEETMFDSQLLNSMSNAAMLDDSIAHYRVDDMGLNEQPVTANTDPVANCKLDVMLEHGSPGSSDPDPVANIAATFIGAPTLEGRFWLLAATILNYILNVVESVSTPRALDDDIVIRSCIEGWVSVGKRYWLDSGWRWIRQIDEHFYSHLSIVNRMAIMRMMRMKYLVQRDPTKAHILDLPDFLRPRPAQEQVRHEMLVEHFVWPGLREHLLFTPDRYVTNKFMDNFRNSLHFAWPHSPLEAYGLNSKSDLYEFTTLYLNHQSQIECWQMKPDFFTLFPELRTDIPTALPPLTSLICSSSAEDTLGLPDDVYTDKQANGTDAVLSSRRQPGPMLRTESIL